MRRAVKAVTYAQLYGAGAQRTADEHDLPLAAVQETFEGWRRSYPRVHAYVEEIKRKCRKTCCIAGY